MGALLALCEASRARLIFKFRLNYKSTKIIFTAQN